MLLRVSKSLTWIVDDKKYANVFAIGRTLTVQLGVPGSRLRAGPEDDRIPILLIQRSIASPTSPNEAIHGFTVIVPRGWSMYLLNSFAYAGCMIGGLVERRNQYREAGLPSFPEHYGSSCPAGLDWEIVKGKEERERWEKKPPAKRPQFKAMGTDNPWLPDWTPIITGDEGDAVEEMETNGKKDKGTSEPWLFALPLSEHLSAIVQSPTPPEVLLKLVNAFRRQRGSSILSEALATELYDTALVHVKVEVEGRGSPGDMAILYALDQAEREKWLQAKAIDRQYGRMDWHAGSTEEPKAEMQKVRRVALLFITLFADRKLGEKVADGNRVVGYTSTGNFSLSRGHGFAIATVSLKAYVQAAKIAKDEGVLVKVKNRDGRLCRLSRLHLA